MTIRRSLAFSFLEKYASTAINIGSTLVLARLLTPEEIGVFSVGAAAVGILHALRDFGITSYLIQEREVGPEKLRTAFTVTTGLSWLFAALLFIAADPAARFYGEEGVREVVWVMAVNFVLIPFGAPILAMLRREMRFARIAAIQLVATAVNAGISILLAATGHGFMSLAWASLAGVATTSLLAFATSPHTFLLRPAIKEWRSVLSFGSYASGNALVAEVWQSAPDLIMGRMLDFEAVGLYSRAKGVLAIFGKLIFEGMQPVLLPALSEKVRRGEDLREIYMKAMEHVTVLYWPFLGFIGLMAPQVILLLLGSQWSAAVPLVQLLAASHAIAFPAFMTQPLLMSLGRIRDVFVMNLVLAPLPILAVVLGSLHSVEMVAMLTIPNATIGILIILRFVGRFIPISLSEVLWATRRSALVAGVSALVPAGLQFSGATAALGAVGSTLVAAAGLGLVWLAMLHLVAHPFRDELRHILARLPWPSLRRAAADRAAGRAEP
ncbi:MAG: lipopolysaccharide biosynthesis protein [Alphaproteobacteria bacterium]|nr:MAG: lipopolysaccharide biosynthesis protein [Alphaproteobacteria bacterium]